MPEPGSADRAPPAAWTALDLATLYAVETPGLTRLAYTYLRNRQDVEDCVQDTFVRALAHPPPPGYAGRWLATVCVNLARDRLRHAAVIRWEPYDPTTQERASRAAGPEAVVVAADSLAGRTADVRAVLAECSASDRAAWMATLSGRPLAVLSAELGRSPTAIKCAAFRVRARLRARLRVAR